MITEGKIKLKVEFGDLVLYRGDEYILEDVVYTRRFDRDSRGERYIRHLVLKGINGLIIVDIFDVVAPPLDEVPSGFGIETVFPCISRNPR